VLIYTFQTSSKNLQRRYQHKKIVLIWDGASYHRFGEFREYLTQVNQEKSPDNLEITCILFAPNAPQQNPVEDVWLQGKNFLRKYWYLCKSFWAVKKLFELFYDCSKFDFPKRVFEKYKIALIFPRDPPKSPLKRGTKSPIPPF
jgi:transposase